MPVNASPFLTIQILLFSLPSSKVPSIVVSSLLRSSSFVYHEFLTPFSSLLKSPKKMLVNFIHLNY